MKKVPWNTKTMLQASPKNILLSIITEVNGNDQWWFHRCRKICKRFSVWNKAWFFDPPHTWVFRLALDIVIQNPITNWFLFCFEKDVSFEEAYMGILFSTNLQDKSLISLHCVHITSHKAVKPFNQALFHDKMILVFWLDEIVATTWFLLPLCLLCACFLLLLQLPRVED